MEWLIRTRTAAKSFLQRKRLAFGVGVGVAFGVWRCRRPTSAMLARWMRVRSRATGVGTTPRPRSPFPSYPRLCACSRFMDVLRRSRGSVTLPNAVARAHARRRTPNAERRTPNAKRQTPNAKRSTPASSLCSQPVCLTREMCHPPSKNQRNFPAQNSADTACIAHKSLRTCERCRLETVRSKNSSIYSETCSVLD